MVKACRISVVLIVAAVALMLSTGEIFAQGRARGGGGGGQGGGGGGFQFFGGGARGGSELMLLRNPQVQQELEVVPSQVSEIEDLQEQMQQKMRTIFDGLRDVPQDQRQERFQEMQQKMTEVNDDFRKKLETVLLPHQLKRLKQISFQMESRTPGRNTVSADRLADTLKLTEDQKQRLRTKAEEVEKKLRDRIAKIRRDAEEELLSVLTSEQRAQYNDLAGEAFELQGGFGFGGGAGGPGGFGGGGAGGGGGAAGGGGGVRRGGGGGNRGNN